jgi:hypothetical protein
MLDGNIQGYAKNRQVAINPIAEQAESTLFHELGHIVLGHTAEGSVNSDSKDRTPRDIRELEAECVALLCCESLGFRAPRSPVGTSNPGLPVTKYRNVRHNESSMPPMKFSRLAVPHESATVR